MASTSNAYDFDLFDSRDHGSAAPKLPEPKAPQKQKQKNNVVKLDEKKAQAKQKRWQQISESAAKQAKRGIVPEILPVMSFAQALDYAKDFEQKLLPYECAEGIEGTRRILSGIQPGQKVAVFIGPEGGFDEKEVEAAKDAGFQVLTLGRRILRTETAGMMLLSVLGYLLEE